MEFTNDAPIRPAPVISYLDSLSSDTLYNLVLNYMYEEVIYNDYILQFIVSSGIDNLGSMVTIKSGNVDNLAHPLTIGKCRICHSYWLRSRIRGLTLICNCNSRTTPRDCKIEFVRRTSGSYLLIIIDGQMRKPIKLNKKIWIRTADCPKFEPLEVGDENYDPNTYEFVVKPRARYAMHSIINDENAMKFSKVDGHAEVVVSSH